VAKVPAAWLGETVPLRAYAGAADGEGTVFETELGLGPVLPLAPVHLRALRDAGGDVALSWVRRSRFDTDSWTHGGGAARPPAGSLSGDDLRRRRRRCG
jgi:hypothetical protein